MQPASSADASAEAPEVIYMPDVLPVITADIQSLLYRLIPLLNREALVDRLPVYRIEVRRFVDPDEIEEEIMVTQWVNASATAAMDYWDRLGGVIEAWTGALPDDLARAAADRIAVEVYWLSDG